MKAYVVLIREEALRDTQVFCYPEDENGEIDQFGDWDDFSAPGFLDFIFADDPEDAFAKAKEKFEEFDERLFKLIECPA